MKIKRYHQFLACITLSSLILSLSGCFSLFADPEPASTDDTTTTEAPSLTLLATTSATGTVVSGVTLDYTLSTENVSTQTITIKVRGASGATPPADCSAGTQMLGATTVASGSGTVNLTGILPGSTMSFRICAYLDGVEMDSDTYASVTAKSHTIFVTSASFNGNLKATYNGQTFTTGIEGADYRCQYLAAQAGLNGTFKAMLGSSAQSIMSHIAIAGTIKNTANQVVASSAIELFSTNFASSIMGQSPTTLRAAIAKTESGANSGSAHAWTGSDFSGNAYAHGGDYCLDWTSSSAAKSAQIGFTSSVNTAAFGYAGISALACNNSKPLYCIDTHTDLSSLQISSFRSNTNVRMSNSTSGQSDITIEFPTLKSNLGSVVIRSLAGDTAPSSACNGSGDTIVSTINDFTSDTVIHDSGHNALDERSYRMCVYSTDGTLLGSMEASRQFNSAQFVAFTDRTYTPGTDFRDRSDADAICESEASASTGITGWKVFLGDSSSYPATNLNFSGSIFGIDTTLIADNLAKLTSGNGAQGNIVDMSSNAIQEYFWSGVNALGTNGHTENCSDWQTDNGHFNGQYGYTETTKPSWLDYGQDVCGNAFRLLCVSLNP